MSIRPVPIPLDVGLALASDDMSGGTQILANWLIDNAGINRPRPALRDMGVLGLPDSPIIGANVYGQDLLLVTEDRRIWRKSTASDTVFALSDPANLATFLDGSKRPVFTADSLRAVIAGGGLLQKWEHGQPFSARLIRLTDNLHLNPKSTHVAYIGNYLVANDTSSPFEIQWSDVGDGVHDSWSALNFNTADADPDEVVAVDVTYQEVFAFGKKTIQVFGLVADQFTPFSTAATTRIGMMAPYSALKATGGFAWLANLDEAPQIVLSDGRTQQVLSGEINSDLISLPRIDDAWCVRFSIGPWNLMGWVFPDAGKFFVYDGTRWSTFDGYDAAMGRFRPMNVNTAIPWAEQRLMLACGNGKVFRFDATARDDDGETVVCVRRTGHYDYGSRNRKKCHGWLALMKRGAGTTSPIPALEIRKADDGGPWSRWWMVPVGTDRMEAKKVFPGGVYRRRQYEIRYSGHTDMSFVNLEEMVEDLPS